MTSIYILSHLFGNCDPSILHRFHLCYGWLVIACQLMAFDLLEIERLSASDGL